MGFLNWFSGNERNEEEWVDRFKTWAEESRRVFREYTTEKTELDTEFNELEWLTQNFVRGYATDLTVHRDMSDSYISICWQACRFGDFTMARIALERAKQWAEIRVWPSDIPVKIGGSTSETESWQSGLPYVECKRCNKASFCAELPSIKKGEDKMDVIVLPPHHPYGEKYVIMRAGLPSGRMATQDGLFVDYVEAFENHKAILFSNAREAIAFAKSRGWSVINRSGDESVYIPPGL